MNLENIDRAKALISDRECLNEIINEMEKNTPVSIWFSVKQRNKTLNFESNDNEFLKDFVSDVYGFSVEYLRDKLLDIDDKLKDL
jgi:hypothetical protein